MAASTRFNMPSLNVWSLDIGLGDTVHSIAHRPVVMSGGDDQVDFKQLAIFIGSVIVDECAAWRFDHTHTVSLVIFAGVENIRAEDIRVFAQHSNSFHGE